MVKRKDKTVSNPDVRENTKSQSRDGSLGSGSSTVWKDGEDVAFASGEIVIDQKIAEAISETSPDKESGKAIAGSKRDFYSSEVISDNKTSDAASPNGKQMVTAKQGNYLGRTDVLMPLGETKEMVLQPPKNVQRTVSRLAASEKEARSLSPGDEIKGPNKRPAVICDFYAKGWCIKGSSCRFLHIKEQKKDLIKQVGDVPVDCKSEVLLEGLRESSHGSGSPSVCDPLAASVGNKSDVSRDHSFDAAQPLELVEIKGSNHIPEVPKFLQREESFPLSFKGIGSEVKRQNGFTNDYGDHGPGLGDRFHLESAVSSIHRFGNLPSCSRSVEELARFQNQRPHNYQIPPLTSDLAGMPSPNSVSTWPRSSLPISYSSLSASQIDSRSSSLLPCPSHVSGSKPENLTPTKRKISLDDWEPSVPFRPSSILRSMVSLPEIEYDPLSDSIELPKAGDVSLKASFYSQGSSIVSTPNHRNNVEAVSENQGLACNEDTMSVSSHNTHHRKDMRTSEVEFMGTSTGRPKRALPKQEVSLGSSAVKDFTEATGNSRRKNHGNKDSLGVKVDNIRQHNQMDVGHIVEQTVNKESKALRQFRAVLIDFVKESLKPKWREGHLSKDVHNKIVKKAVEKVLSTLPIEQVPTSMELTTQYLAMSRSKIDKLVEGYAEIYGKA